MLTPEKYKNMTFEERKRLYDNQKKLNLILSGFLGGFSAMFLLWLLFGRP